MDWYSAVNQHLPHLQYSTVSNMKSPQLYKSNYSIR